MRTPTCSLLCPTLALLMTCAALPSARAAQGSGPELPPAHANQGSDPEPHADEGGGSAHDEAAGHAEHDHHLALFLGATYVEESTYPTVGLDYEYRLPFLDRLFGVGPMIEYIHEEHAVLIGAVALYVHPWAGLKLFADSGYEYSEEHGDFLVRLGAGYDFHLGSVSLTPTAAVDFVHGHTAIVGGLALGYVF